MPHDASQSDDALKELTVILHLQQCLSHRRNFFDRKSELLEIDHQRLRSFLRDSVIIEATS
ncbi:hypothetical protein MPL1_07273 [Methylophaga lonarensis MPL]|uniref:Uncharacterized protein n=1 Tax=Methylophaga lonarensis MPL TaxID=1286106 RepID=M7PGJ6_9GAMM|nr:hypothetical protein MPL1_07273 [Methylophaga lonarensis MPL]